MTHRFFPLLSGLLGLILLGACSGLATLNQVATPTELYVLTPKSTFDPSLPRLSQQLVVEEPTATAAISTDRIAISPSPLRVQYFPEVRWVDRAPVIVQALLIESYENSGKVAAVGRSTVSLRADYLIVTDMREFNARLANPQDPENSPLEVNVRLNMKIVDTEFDRIIASQSFEEFHTAASDDIDDIAVSFDEALGDAIRDLVEWSVREIHAHARENKQPDDF